MFEEMKFMGKELSEMTLEELWELFPIFLVEHTDKWQMTTKSIEILLQVSVCKLSHS